MTNEQQTAAIGLASEIITRLAWENFQRSDRIHVTEEQLRNVKRNPDQIVSIIRSYSPRSGWLNRLRGAAGLPLNQRQADQVIEILVDQAPQFDRLPQLRALEGIKVFDLHFGSDHAEVLMYDYVQEAIFDEIQALEWFGSEVELIQ